MTTRIPVDRNRAFRMAGALVGLAVVLGACTHTDEVVTTASIPDDYRLRHPIAIQEANQSVVIFVGHARGGLSASQRADVMGLAQTWLHEGTGAIIADLPVDTPNARAAADAIREIQALLDGRRRAAARHHRAPLSSRRSAPDGDDPAELSEDLGGGRSLRPVARGSRPLDQEQGLFRKQGSTTISAAPISATWRRWSTIRRTSCSRGPKPPPIRRGAPKAFEKYRKGTPTTTTYPEADKAKLSDTGK